MTPDAVALREEATATAERLARAIDELELSSWFTGEFDHGDAIVTIKPGQGGLEAQDWTFMLFKMYMKYCQRRGWKVTINAVPQPRSSASTARPLLSRARTHLACCAPRPASTAWFALAPPTTRSAARPRLPARGHPRATR